MSAPDPVALQMLIEWAGALGIPAILPVAVHYGESKWNLYASGDSGRAAGGLQMRTDVWGHDPAWWMGVDGLARSIAAITPQWQGAITPPADGWYGWTWGQQVAAFATFWQTAQRASGAAVRAAAEDALAAAYDAMEGYDLVSTPTVGRVAKPPIKWLPAFAENYSTDRTRLNPAGVRYTPDYEAIVWHTTDGGATLEALAGWFGQRQIINGVQVRSSTPFGVDRTGRIGQFVSLQNRAFAHGIVQNATAQIVLDNAGIDPNYWAVGIELLDGGTPGDHTPVQLEAAAQLAAWLCDDLLLPKAALTGFAINRERNIGHYQIDGVDRAHCPSWPESRFTWMIARINQIVAAARGAAPPPPATDYRAAYRAELVGLIQAATDDGRQASERAAVRIAAAQAKIDALDRG